MSLIDNYLKIKTLDKTSIILGEYVPLTTEIVSYLIIQNKREFLLSPNQYQMAVLHLINNLTQLEADKKLFALHLNISEKAVEKGGYNLRIITSMFSKFVEDFFFYDEFSHGDYSNNEVRNKFMNSNSNVFNQNLIITPNNKKNLYDFDAKVDNTTLFVDIKGRYEKIKTLKNIDPNDACYLDEKTILKYYCRKINDRANIWFAMYHNYGPGDFGISYLSFDTLLSYLDIELNTNVSQFPTTHDLLNNKFPIVPMTISLSKNRNVGHKLLSNEGGDIVEITNINKSIAVNFNYKILTCSRRKFINTLTKQ